MKKLSSMIAIAALSAVGAAPALAQDSNDPFVSSQESFAVIDVETGLVVGMMVGGFFLALFDNDSSTATTTTTTP